MPPSPPEGDVSLTQVGGGKRAKKRPLTGARKCPPLGGIVSVPES